MSHKIATVVAMTGVVGLLAIATAALADGTNSNGNTNTNSGNKCQTVGCIKCVYAGYPESTCVGKSRIADNKNSE